MSGKFIEDITSQGRHNLQHLLLNAEPPPWYDSKIFNFLWQPESTSADATDADSVNYLLQQVKLFNQADMLVLALPVWNHSIPAILKAWIDILIAPNYTYQFSAQGIQPLHRIQQLLLLVSSGGPRDKVNAGNHFQHTLEAPFRYIQIERIETIWAEKQEPALFADHAKCLQTAVHEIQTYIADNL